MEKAFKWKGELSWCSGGKIAFWGVYACVCACVCLYTHSHTCKSTRSYVWAIGVCYVHCKNLFMVSWPSAKVLTTNLPHKARPSLPPHPAPPPTLWLQGSGQRNLSQKELLERRLWVGVGRNALLLLQRAWKILGPGFLSNTHRSPVTSQFNNAEEYYNSSGNLHLLNPDFPPLNGVS